MSTTPSVPYVVTESLVREHRIMEGLLDRLDAGLAGYLAAPAHNDKLWRDLQEVFSRIDMDINTHFICEEQALFPMVWVYRSMVLMEVEHDELFAMRDLMLNLFAAVQPTAQAREELSELVPRFTERLRAHIVEEDRGVFPYCERMLNAREKERVMERMEEIRAEARQSPLSAPVRPETWFRPIEPCGQPYERPVDVRLLAESTQLQVKEYRIRAGESLARHWTPTQVLLQCLSGEGTFRAKDQGVSLVPGTLLLLSPRLYFAVDAATDISLMLVMQELLPDRMQI